MINSNAQKKVRPRLRWLTELILFKTYANLRAESSRTYLAFLWWVLEPAFMMLVYYLVFSQFLTFREASHVPFLLIGVVGWHWFSRTVMNCREAIGRGIGLMTKIPINGLFFPTVIILTDVIKALFIYLVLISVLSFLGYYPTVCYLALPLLIGIQLSLIIACSYWLALLVPLMPDLRHIVGVLMLGGMFASGIFYSPERLPPEVREIFYYNPMAILLDSYRGLLLDGQWIHGKALITILVFSLAITALAIRFERWEHDWLTRKGLV